MPRRGFPGAKTQPRLMLACLLFPNVFAFLTTQNQSPSTTRFPLGTVSSPHRRQQQPERLNLSMSSPAAFYDLSAVEADAHTLLVNPSWDAAVQAWDSSSLPLSLDGLTQTLALTPEQAETLAGPLFGASLFPYLAFLFFLSRPVVQTPKGVTVGFATCLLFVFLTIPAAIAAKVLYGVSLADSDWLHGSAESLLTLTNLVTVVAFRQALQARETGTEPPASVTSYSPMVLLVIVGTLLAGLTAAVPALATDTAVHTPYLAGFMDLPLDWANSLTPHAQPSNALSVTCWIIHISSLVEFLVAMGFCWRWADVSGQPTWRGLTWGLLPLHSSGITACTYHLFYNQIPSLVPLQAFLTCIGNTTAAYATWRIARACGWTWGLLDMPLLNDILPSSESDPKEASKEGDNGKQTQEKPNSLVGFEDLGQALAADSDYTFLAKLFVGCAVASYAIKYGEVWFDFPFDASVYAGLAFVFIPSLLNAYKWNQRSYDDSFEGWF